MTDLDTVKVPSTEIDQEILSEHNSIPVGIRQDIRQRDGRCQLNGCQGPRHDGTANLLVQRLEDDPDHCDRDAPENLVTRCHRCCRWVKKMPSPEDLQTPVQARLNGVEIKSSHVEILQYLTRNGPATTGEIQPHVQYDSEEGVRKAIYTLMAIDQREPEVTDRIVVKDRFSGEYGLPEQIPEDRIARGIIPLDPQIRRARILDEITRRTIVALDDVCDSPREVAAEIVGRDSHQTRTMQKRAQAFQFPFRKWAKKGKPRNGAGTVIEAIDALAATTENLSRQLVSEELVAIFGTHDEQEIAAAIQEWSGGRPSRQKPLDALSQTSLDQPGRTNSAETGPQQSNIERQEEPRQTQMETEKSGHSLEPTHIGGEDDESIE